MYTTNGECPGARSAAPVNGRGKNAGEALRTRESRAEVLYVSVGFARSWPRGRDMIHLNRVQWNNSTDLLVGDSESPEEGRHGLVVDLLSESDAARVNLEEAAVAITATDPSRYIVHCW